MIQNTFTQTKRLEFFNNAYSKSKIEKLVNSKNLEHITNIFFSQEKNDKKPMKLLFNDYQIIAKKLNIDLSLRPQNISKDQYLEICKCYEDLKH